MGAVMAPAAAKVINDHLKDTNRTIDYYDLILTGDLGRYGKEIVIDYSNGMEITIDFEVFKEEISDEIQC